MTTKEKDLKNNDVCSIIKACHENGVEELTFGRLHIKFKVSKKPETILEEPETINTNIIETQTREVREQEEFRIKEDQLEQMAIEDPLHFEELINSGDLRDARA